MKFSVKNRVEKLLSRDRLQTAIVKLKRFTKAKPDYAETYDELCDLSGQLANLSKKRTNKEISYEEQSVTENRIRLRLQEINNEQDELKDTVDRKYVWGLFWKVLTGIMIPIIAVLIPLLWENWKTNCPKFQEGSCRMLLLDMQTSNRDVNGEFISSRIDEAIHDNPQIFEDILTSRLYNGPETPGRELAEIKVNECNANFALYGYVDRKNDDYLIELNSFPSEPGLSDSLGISRDTMELPLDAGQMVLENKYLVMFKLMACTYCNFTKEQSAPIIEELKAHIDGMDDPRERAKARNLLMTYYYAKSNLEGAENMVNLIIDENPDMTKAFAIRGKIMDDQERYSMAMTDYSTYLEKFAGNHNIRYRRFNTIYHQVRTNTWRNKYGDYIRTAESDLMLLKGNIPPAQYKIAMDRLQRMKDIMRHNTPQENDLPMCVIKGRILNEANQVLSNAVVELEEIGERSTNSDGHFSFDEIPCAELLGRRYSVFMDGYHTYQNRLQPGQTSIELRLRAIEPTEEQEPCTLIFKIQDLSGAGIEEAELEIEDFGTRFTNRDGIVEITASSCEAFDNKRYRINAAGHQAGKGIISPGKYEIVFALESNLQTLQIKGSVFDNIYRRPISRVQVYIADEPRVLTNSRGGFDRTLEIRENEAGQIPVHFKHKSYHDAEIVFDPVRDEFIELGLTPIWLSGHVTDNNGRGIPAAAISIENISKTRTDETGRFKLEIPADINNQAKMTISKKGFRSRTISLNESKEIKLSPYLQIVEGINLEAVELAPGLTQSLIVHIEKEVYSDSQRKWIYVPAAGADVYVDNKHVGSTNKNGEITINLIGRINKQMNLNVKGVNGIPTPRLPHSFKFTKNGQRIEISYYVLK